jgi:hypothetical protein
MIAYSYRWVLLAALAEQAATTWPLAARAESLTQIRSAPYLLADAADAHSPAH